MRAILTSRETPLDNLVYREEHVTCTSYRSKDDANFRYMVLPKGENTRNEKHPYNILVFMLSGCIEMSCKEYRHRKICCDEMILVPQGTDFDWEATEDSECIVFRFRNPESNCDKQILEALWPICEKMEYDFTPTAIKDPMKRYLELLTFYLRTQINCVHFHEIKHREFFLCLRAFYTRTEIAKLLFPLIGRTPGFRDFVHNNYDPLITVNELIERSHMGKTHFHDLFKTEFGITAKNWLLQHKLKDIRYAAMRPGISVKELMVKFGFDTSSSFVQFCRKHYGSTPSELIDSVKSR